jgi:hypothetical protein
MISLDQIWTSGELFFFFGKDNETLDSVVGFEVFTAVTMKNAVSWDVAPCRFNVNRRFARTCRLHLQGR